MSLRLADRWGFLLDPRRESREKGDIPRGLMIAKSLHASEETVQGEDHPVDPGPSVFKAYLLHVLDVWTTNLMPLK